MLEKILESTYAKQAYLPRIRNDLKYDFVFFQIHLTAAYIRTDDFF